MSVLFYPNCRLSRKLIGSRTVGKSNPHVRRPLCPGARLHLERVSPQKQHSLQLLPRMWKGALILLLDFPRRPPDLAFHVPRELYPLNSWALCSGMLVLFGPSCPILIAPSLGETRSASKSQMPHRSKTHPVGPITVPCFREGSYLNSFAVATSAIAYYVSFF